MAVDPIIARGAELPDLMRPLILAEEIKNRRETNKLYAVRQQMEQQRYAQEQQAAQQAQTAEAEKQQAIAVYHAAKAGNPMARNFALKKLSETTPGIFDGIDPEQAWTQIEPIMRQTLGIEMEQPKQQTLYSTEAGYLPADQAQGKMPYRAPQQPPQYAPTEQERNWKLRESLSPEKRAEFDRFYGKGKGDDSSPGDTRIDARMNDAQNVKEAISRARSLVSPWSTGLVGQKAREIGGTPAYNLNTAVDTIKANIGFDRLQRMREESKTGGALGQVAVQELTMLQATIASLDTAQSQEEFLKSLKAVEDQYDRAIESYNAAMAERDGVQASGPRIKASDLPPPAALKQLQEGKVTTFANGQRWTAQNGQAVRVQ